MLQATRSRLSSRSRSTRNMRSSKASFYASRHHNGPYCMALFERPSGRLSFDRAAVGAEYSKPDIVARRSTLPLLASLHPAQLLD